MPCTIALAMVLRCPYDALAVVDEDVERGVHAGERHRVAAVGAAVQHGAVGLERHDLLLAAERRRARRAAAHRFGHAGDVGGDLVELLGAAQRDAEAGDDLVEDEEHAVVVADAAQAFEEAGLGRDDAGVGEDGLREHAGQLVAVALDDRLNGVQIVEAGDDHGVFERLGDAGRRRQGARVALVPAAPSP